MLIRLAAEADGLMRSSHKRSGQLSSVTPGFDARNGNDKLPSSYDLSQSRRDLEKADQARGGAGEGGVVQAVGALVFGFVME